MMKRILNFWSNIFSSLKQPKTKNEEEESFWKEIDEILEEAEQSGYFKQLEASEDKDAIYTRIEVFHAIRLLDINHKLPFELYLNGKKHEEIARLMGLDVDTIIQKIESAETELYEILNKNKTV